MDMVLPLGVADGMLYAVLVLVGLLARDRRFIVGGAVVGSVLTLAGFFLSPPGVEQWTVVVNRGLSIAVIWMTAVFCLLQNRSQIHLKSAHDRLEDRVKERTAQLNETNLRLRQESEFVKLHKDIAVASNETRAVEDTMRRCIERICVHTGWPVGHLYQTTDRRSNRLEPSGIWYFENPERFETFRKVSEETGFDPGVGLPGRVLQSGKPAWIIDVTKDPNFPRAKLAENIGVKAGFAFPVLIGTEVVGVMEFFSAKAAEPDAKMLDIMAQVGTQMGRVIERRRAEEDNRDSHERLRKLYHRLELVREEERTRIAREVHDELAQVLTILKLELSLLDKKISKFNSKLQSNTRMMLELIDNTIQSVKKIGMDLRPPLLDDLGLSEAIKWHGTEFERRTGIHCAFNRDGNGINLDEARSTTVFRIFQEALTNVVRHARAKNVDVCLKDENGFLILGIKDDGIGISPNQISNARSLGLLGMRERAMVWGGQVDIEGTTDQGTTVTIKIRNGT